jgi:hypothetical protein
VVCCGPEGIVCVLICKVSLMDASKEITNERQLLLSTDRQPSIFDLDIATRMSCREQSLGSMRLLCEYPCYDFDPFDNLARLSSLAFDCFILIGPFS